MKYFLILLLVIGAGCRKSESVFDGREDIVQVSDNDSKMQAAQQKARDTMDEFIGKLPNLKDGEAIVKWAAPATDGSEEHIWVEDVTFVDGKFTGKLANEPAAIEGKKVGDKVTFPKADASDWAIFYHDGRSEGGFTNKVLEEQAGKEGS